MLKIRPILYMPKRWMAKKLHWSVLENKKFTKNKALENFDDFYGSVFGNRWKSIRAALLTKNKYIAIINTFGDPTKISNEMELQGAINVKSLVELGIARQKNNNSTGIISSDSKSTIPVHKLDENLSIIIRKQEEIELKAVYPADYTLNNIENIEKINNDNSVGIISSDNKVDYKKSLEQVTEENTEIDFRRIVNVTKQGTAGLNDFLPATKLKGMEDFIPESEHYKYYCNKTTDFPISFNKQEMFKFPENLNLYTYEMGNCSKFISPKKCSTGVQSHYLMDGASILPPLFLDIQKGDKVLDACAAPGGKSLLMLQTLHPSIIICNDIQESRIKRIRNIFKQFLFDYNDKWNNEICKLTQRDARIIDEYNEYDKILVDVPCTTDRHSVMENDNNIFKTTRIKERIRLPELQSAILSNCLRLLKPGGSLVYSTCSLSPIQNDGVVHMALKNVFVNFNITTTIRDLSECIECFNEIYEFEDSKRMKYGQMVLPYLPANYGPMYFCKITRNE